MHGRVQVISWSNEEGREQTRCHLSLPPFHNDGTGFGAALDEMANRPHIMDWQVGGETRPVAMGRAVFWTFDSVYAQELQGARAANTESCIPQV